MVRKPNFFEILKLKIFIFTRFTLLMARAFFVLICLTLIFGACTQRVICPAYQSAFIYDKEALRKKFSYFQEDSTPKVFTASKNKYLIAEPVSYRKKIRSMQTVEMKPVNVVLPDSMQVGNDDIDMGEDGVVPGAELDMAARSVIDSIYIVDVPKDTATVAEDSVYMISKDKEVRLLKYDFPDSLIYDPASGKYVAETPRYYVTEVKFNVEQDNYMWYLRNYLILPDVMLAKQQQGQKAEEAKGEKKGFFKNLFGKKKKKEAEADTTATQTAPKEEFDYVDEDEQLKPAVPQEEVKEKKGLFGRKKKKADPAVDDGTETDKPKKKKEKKSKKKKKDEVKPAEEQKDAKEEEDDGF